MKKQLQPCIVHGVAICTVYSADKPFNNFFLLIVVEVNRSQIMTSHGIHRCQDITVLYNNVKPFLKSCVLSYA